MLKNVLRKMDIFSKTPMLMYKCNTHIPSISGGFFSFLAIILVLLSIVYFSKDLYKRTNPTTFSKSLLSSNFSFFNFSEENNFILAIQNPPIYESGHSKKVENLSKVFDYNNSYITEDYHLVSPYIEYFAVYKYLLDENTEKHKTVNLRLKNCSVTEIGRNGYLCVEFNNTILGLGNIYRKSAENFVQIYIDVCRNRSELPFACKTEYEIKNWLEFTGYITILKPDIQIQMDILNDPFEMMLSYNMIPLDLKTYYQRVYNYDVAILETDSGLVFSSNFINNFIQFSFSEDLYLKRMVLDELVKIKLTTTNKTIIYKRKFAKFQEVFANIGGILKLVIVFFKLISMIFVEKSYFISISRDLWEESEYMNKNEDNRLDHINSMKKNKSIDVSTDLNLSKLNNSIKDKKKFLKYTRLDFIASIICIRKCKKTEVINLEKIYSLSKKRITKRLDIVEIIKYLIEIDRLKFILFDESQLNSLNYLKENKIEFYIDYIKDELNNISLVDNYNKLSNCKRSFKKYDNKILSILERKMIK